MSFYISKFRQVRNNRYFPYGIYLKEPFQCPFFIRSDKYGHSREQFASDDLLVVANLGRFAIPFKMFAE